MSAFVMGATAIYFLANEIYECFYPPPGKDDKAGTVLQQEPEKHRITYRSAPYVPLAPPGTLRQFNQLHSPFTLPSATSASVEKVSSVISRSSGWQPVHRSTTVKSTVTSPPTRFTRSDFPHKGLLFGLLPVCTASKIMCDTATILSPFAEVTPHAPRPGS